MIARTAEPDLEDLTCIDLKQAWGKLKKNASEMHNAVPIQDFCHPKLKRCKAKVCITPRTLEKRKSMDFLEMLMNGK